MGFEDRKDSGDDRALALALLQAGSNVSDANQPRWGQSAPGVGRLFTAGATGFAQGMGNAEAWKQQQQREQEETTLNRLKMQAALMEQQTKAKYGGLSGDAGNLAVLLGRQPTAEEYAGFKQSLRPVTNVSVNTPFETKFDEGLGTGFAKTYQDIQDQANSAMQMGALYDLAEQALTSDVRTGFGGEIELGARKFGQMLGVGDADKLAGGELLTSIQNRMALIMRSPSSGGGMPGAVSDKDIQFLKQAQVGIDRSPEGNRKMIESFRRMENRKIEIATLADHYIQQKGRLDPGFNRLVREYANQNPLFGDMGGSPTGQAPAKRPPLSSFNK